MGIWALSASELTPSTILSTSSSISTLRFTRRNSRGDDAKDCCDGGSIRLAWRRLTINRLARIKGWVIVGISEGRLGSKRSYQELRDSRTAVYEELISFSMCILRYLSKA